MKNKKIIIFILVIVIILDGIYLYHWMKESNSSNEEEKHIQEVVDINADTSSDYKMTKGSFKELEEQYPDMVGYIEFPNGFLSEPIVQATDNDYYLHHYIDGTLSTEGAIYMDSDCNPANQNITIYGHNIYYDDNARFSPLQKLESQSEYEKYHEFKVWYLDHVSTYTIAYIAKYNVNTDKDFDFKIKNFYTDEIYNDYIKWMNEHQQIMPVDSEIGKLDNIVTLQTCIRWEKDNRYLVVGKEVNRNNYDTE